MSPKLHTIQQQYLTYSISFKSGFVLSPCLCLWTPCLISIRECSSWVGACWQLVFVFRLQYVCLIQSLIVCGVLFNGPKGTTSAQIAHFIQDGTMMQSDLQPTLAQKHTNTHLQTHTIPINLLDNLYWALLERKKRMRKSIGQWPPWNSCCCIVTRRFHMCTAPILDREKVERDWRKYKEGC